jgi:hypothetical protein
VVTPTVIEIRRNGNIVGEPAQLARGATPAAGETERYGQHRDEFMRITHLPAGFAERRLGHLGVWPPACADQGA